MLRNVYPYKDRICCSECGDLLGPQCVTGNEDGIAFCSNECLFEYYLDMGLSCDDDDSYTEIGKKFDDGKLRYDLLDPKFIEGIVAVLTDGAKDYGDDNWQQVQPFERRYKAALLRHLFSYLQGEKIDPKSGKSHLYHIACNAMFLDWKDRQERK